MWTHGFIGDVLSLIQNGVNCKQDKSGVGDKVSRIETIADSNINYEKTGFAVLDEKQKAKSILHEGDILFSHINSPAHVGKTAIYDGVEPLYHGINLLRLQTIDAVDSRYFNMFLISLFQNGYWKRTSKQSVNQASVNQTDIKLVPFSYPPLAEQQRIVAKLDATFMEIDKAIELENTKSVELKILTESFIEKLFNNENYDLHALSDVCEFIGGSQPPKSVFEYEKKDNNIRLIQIRDYKSDSHLTYIPTKKAKRLCDEQDVMIGRYGPPIFQILRGIKGAYNVALMKAIPKEGLDNDYLFHFLTNRKIQNYVINKSIRAAGQSGVNKDALEPYPIYLPPIEIQLNIVSKAKEINSHVSIALNCIEKKVNQLKQLKTSLLQQELVQSEAA